MKEFPVFASALLLSVAALAQTPASPQAPAPQTSGASIFDSFDSDHDGRITATEAQVSSTITENFKGADADGDGTLSQAEFDAAFKPANSSEQSPPKQ